MKNLRLPLVKKWFEMTKTGEKKEDYRDITPYWCNRFLLYKGEHKQSDWWRNEFLEMVDLPYYPSSDLSKKIDLFCSFKNFDNNIMTLGYPRKNDSERVLKLFNRGVEVAYGHPEWGAKPNTLYFVIKHGAIK